MSFLFGGSTSSTPTSSTSTTKLPAWMEEGGKDTFNFAKQVANRPYIAYEGPRMAGLSDSEQTGIAMGRNTGSYAPALGRSGELLDQAAGGIPGVDINAYMNPYEDQVVAGMMGDLDRARQKRAIEIGDRAAATGNFGASRHGVMESELDRSYLDSVGRESGNLRYQGYNAAMGLASGDLNRQASVGNDFMRMGALVPELQRGDISTLLQTGAIERGEQQGHLDLAYRDFLEERGYPLEQLEIMRQGLGVPTSTTTTSTGQQVTQDPSMAGQLGGLGMAAYGLYTMSDVRLKRAIRRTGTLESGIPVYRFRYVWGGPEHVGVLAHEVEAVMPEAVATLPNGYQAVDYGRLAMGES